jgi:conjugative relaxase-like TrwC/TraI family protein
MLSIGNGKAWYYANLAEKDDYYQQGAEPPGQWYGKGAEEFRLQGEVSKQDFYALCAGYDPRSAEKLVHHAGTERRRALWDFTFSAPKGVSVWWGKRPENVSAIVSSER